jgi:shikimate kinase
VRGVGTTSGAVTIVNALPTGIGCAVAVAIPVRAEVELQPAAGLAGHRIRIDREGDSALVRGSVDVALARFAPHGSFTGTLRIVSEVPAGKGLKSSSAVGGAVLRAIARAFRESPPLEELARLGADLAQQIGLSATGAFDDGLAALRGGVALTDNSRRTTLRAGPFDTTLKVVLWLPPGVHPPSPGYLERFRREGDAGRAAAEAARNGRWAEAMERNTELVERLMGYDHRELRADLLRSGAVMTGVSGMGPALATFVPEAGVPAIVERLPTDRGEVRVVGIRPLDDSSPEFQ